VSLREKLGIVTALAAAACGGKIASDGSSGGGATTTPPNDDVCPYTVELRGFDVTVSADAACKLAAGAPPCFGSYCQPARADCPAACGDPAVNECTLPSSYLGDFKVAQRDGGPVCPPADPMTLHCAVIQTRGTKTNGCPVEGRRPAALVAHLSDDDSLGSYFAECEWLEAASVVAFEELAGDLERLGAPRELVSACHDAARDEERHALAMGAMRARFGGRAQSVSVRTTAPQTLLDLASLNAIEGVVRETFGAAVALWRSTHASDPEVRSALSSIAEDECRHAELARRVASFLDEQLDPRERRHVARLEQQAIDALGAALDAEPSAAVADLAGAPTAREARAIHDALVREVWERV
jgi:hypothetical protein